MNESVNNSEQQSADLADGDQGEIARLKKKLGEQGNELGSLRNALEAKIDAQDAALIGESFDSDQIAAVERMVERKLQPVQQAVSQTTAQAAEAKLLSEHPDYEEVVQGAEFQSWVNESKVNSAAYNAAITGDIDTGIDLLNQFKSSHPSARPQEALDTALTSARGSSGDSGIREGGVLSRAEIQNLKITDKAKYRAMLPEIMRAYQEGRVR